MPYIVIAITAFVVSVLAGRIVRAIAIRFGVTDDPTVAPERKKQLQPVPLLGGIALYIAFCFTVLVWFGDLTAGYLLPKYVVGILLAGAVLMIGGYIDDRYNLNPRWQLVAPVLAVLITIASGIGIPYISNPFGGVINLEMWRITVFTWHSIPYSIVILADLFAFVWIFGSMYTTKLSDGIDGLVPGITAIGGIIIGIVSLSQTVQQPETAAVAFTVAAIALGFLVWNFSPAKLYLGEGGSLFCGYLLGVLAIISGGKIATALLILSIPIIDAMWVILRRAFIEKRSIFSGDTLHLHYQLQDLGLSVCQIVLLYYVVTLSIASTTLLVSGRMKAIVLTAVVVVVSGFLTWITKKARAKQS